MSPGRRTSPIARSLILAPVLLAAAGAVEAAPPNAMPDSLQVGSGRIDQLQASTDGSVVVGRDGTSGSVWLLSVDDWSAHQVSACSQARSATVAPYGSGIWEVWVACGNGRLEAYHFDGEGLSPAGDGGQALSVEVGTGLGGAWYHEIDDAIYVIETSEQNPHLHVLDLQTLAVNASPFAGYPLGLPRPGYNTATLYNDTLFVHHSGAQMSTVFVGPTASVNPGFLPSFGFTLTGMAPSPSGSVYAVDGDSALAEFLPTTGQFAIMATDLDAADAVATSLEPGDEWLLIAGNPTRVWTMGENGGLVGMPDDPARTIVPDAPMQAEDAIVVDGYALVGGAGGQLHVLTARPWIYPDRFELTPDFATRGDTVTVRFEVDQPGEWQIRRGGNRTGTGALLQSGTVSSGEGLVEASFTVEDGWAEGDNAVYVVHRNTQTQLTGHARASLVVDNPPDPPSLQPSNLRYSDGALVLSFAGIPDADLDRYEVYVTTTPFEPAAYPTGGPDYDGATDLETPITIRQQPGEPVSVRIEPLENYVKHFVAVRAWDEGGKEGPMSQVLSETPRPSFTAGDLAGEQGGTPCSTAPTAAGWLALGVGLLGAARRRRAFAGAAALVGVGLLGTAPAQAADDGPTGDLTPVYGNFEVRYGVMNLEDDNINTVYNKNPHNMLQIEFGPQFFRVFELDVGLGFFQELSTTMDLDGAGGADKTMLTMWPFMVGGTFRLQLLDEQLVVPHVRYGFDYVVYSELSDDGMGGKESLRGAKVGNHWGFGAGLLLDFFAPRRASMLEATTGINDTYLVFEWRRQNVDHRRLPWDAPMKQGFDFSGTMFTVGIKLDY